jgi:hypothetical protein
MTEQYRDSACTNRLENSGCESETIWHWLLK